MGRFFTYYGDSGEGFVCSVFGPAHFQVFGQTFWVECSRTVWTFLKRFDVVVFKSCVVVGLKIITPSFCTGNSLIEVLRGVWARFTHFNWLFGLLNIPFLPASFEMDLKTQGAVLSTTDIAHQSSRPFNDFDRFRLHQLS